MSYQLDHPAPWWHFRWFLTPYERWRRPRLTRASVYGFLFVFAYVFLRTRLRIYHPRDMKTSLLLAFVFALLGAFLGSSIEDRESGSK
jgi:hypothetical protein